MVTKTFGHSYDDSSTGRDAPTKDPAVNNTFGRSHDKDLSAKRALRSYSGLTVLMRGVILSYSPSLDGRG